MYSFASRSPLLKVVFETPDSNRNWKSRYFFLEGNTWMNRPGETEYLPVDTTWGVINPSRMYPPNCYNSFLTFYYKFHNRLFFFASRRRPQVSVEEFGFLERIFQKTKPEERTWAKLVNPKTIHWYCDGPEPTRETIVYDERVHRRKSVNLYS